MTQQLGVDTQMYSPVTKTQCRWKGKHTDSKHTSIQATALNPLSGEVNNIDYLVTMQRSAGKLWFTWMQIWRIPPTSKLLHDKNFPAGKCDLPNHKGCARRKNTFKSPCLDGSAWFWWQKRDLCSIWQFIQSQKGKVVHTVTCPLAGSGQLSF